VGFAYDVFGDGKTAVRGGYGIYYGRIINAQILNAFSNTGSPSAQLSYFMTPTGSGAPLYPSTLSAPPSGPSSKPDVFFFQKNFQAPLIHEADLVIEREIAHNTVVSASWLFSKGTDLPVFLDTNLNAPTQSVTYTVSGGPDNGKTYTTPVFTGARPNANFGRITQITSSVESNYNALVLQVNRRWTNGLQFQTSYTWSHAIDNGQSANAFAAGDNVLNPFNLNLERSDSTFDVRQRFVTSIVWSPTVRWRADNRYLHAILSNWTMAPVFQTASPRPWANTTSGSTATIGGRINGTTTSGVNGSGGTNRPFWLSRNPNQFRFPDTWNLDARLSRRIPVAEGKTLEFLVEAFNLFNHVNPTDVNRTMYIASGSVATGGTLTYQPTFGSYNAAGNTIFRERQIQLAARFHF
jgi:hypothetical protein